MPPRRRRRSSSLPSRSLLVGDAVMMGCASPDTSAFAGELDGGGPRAAAPFEATRTNGFQAPWKLRVRKPAKATRRRRLIDRGASS